MEKELEVSVVPKNDKKPEKDEEILSESDKEMLNLIAEMVVQIIIKKTENECNRLYTNQHKGSI